MHADETPREQERLLVHVAADVAGPAGPGGLKLNHGEPVATITSHIPESGRERRTVAELTESGRTILTGTVSGDPRDDPRGPSADARTPSLAHPAVDGPADRCRRTPRGPHVLPAS
ncbi:urease subunit gamma [Streptomyces sp. NPDC059373]